MYIVSSEQGKTKQKEVKVMSTGEHYTVNAYNMADDNSYNC